jgi:hypothetical protein
MFTFVAKCFSSEVLCKNHTLFGTLAGLDSCIVCSGILQLFAKYNKKYQNVNSKRLHLTSVYFLTLNDHLAIFDFDTPTLVLHHSGTG